MLELTLCSMLTILPDYLYRRFAQGKRFGHEITLFTVWYELRWGITLCLLLTVTLITTIFYFHPATTAVNSVFRTVTILPETSGRVAETFVESNQRVKQGDPLFRLDDSQQKAEVETARARISELEAERVGVVAQLAQADAGIAQAVANLRQAQDEYDVRAELHCPQLQRHFRTRGGAGACQGPGSGSLTCSSGSDPRRRSGAA
jgi:multidrug resistance efflux pump